MTATLKIRMDSAAFWETGEPEMELSRILENLASEVRSGGLPGDGLAVRDTNGNPVGELRISGERLG